MVRLQVSKYELINMMSEVLSKNYIEYEDTMRHTRGYARQIIEPEAQNEDLLIVQQNKDVRRIRAEHSP
jgi:hypothetical protein